MSLSATLFGRDSLIHRATNILGLGIPGWLDKKFGAPETEGPRLDDLSVQTSTYGVRIPRYYGMCAGAGNLIQLERNKLKETVRKKKSGGKGGGGSSKPTTTYSYSATFQLALCEGPIVGVRRIWCGDILIYNAGSDDLNSIIASNQAAKGWRLYLGTDDQLPDPRYEAEYGVGNVSAHRGLAYIAFYDFQLANYSNTLQGSQFKVEILTKRSSSGLRMLLDKTMFISSGSPAPGYFISGSISDVDGEGAYAIDGIASGASTYICRTSGGVVFEKYYGAQPTYSASDLKGCDDHDFAWWRGPNVPGAPFLTKNGNVYAGEIGQSFGSLIKSQGQFFYFQHDSTIARKCSFIVGQVVEYAIASSRLHAVYGSVAYGLSTDMQTLYAWSVNDFELIGATPITNSSVFAVGLINEGSLRYCDGSNIYITSPTGSSERVIAINLLSGAASIYAEAPLWEGTNSNGAIRVSGDIYYRLYYGAVAGSHPNRAIFRVFQIDKFSAVNESLSEIIKSELKSSGMLTDDDIDISLISSTVRGYRVAGGSIREAIEPLQAAFPFDAVQSGYKIKFVPRGVGSVATIPWTDLGATSGGKSEEMFSQSREMDTQLPARTVVKYIDAAREYSISEQYSERLNTEAVNKVEKELPIVLAADEAANTAEILNFLPWLERTDAQFTLPPIYQRLEPADVVTLETQQATYTLRLIDVSYTADGRLECAAKPDRAALYTPGATGAEGVPPTGEIPLPGQSLLLLLDIPVVDETLQDAAGFVGVMTGYFPAWAGGLVVRSNDSGQTWTDLQAFTGLATTGHARNALPASTGYVIDQRSLTVDLISGDLESITRDQMLAGQNYAAYGADGRWEIVRFQVATLQANGSYLLSHFVRGDRGTEWASGLHQSGDALVLLDDPDNSFIGMAAGSIGLPATYRGITSGSSLDSASDIGFTYQGVNLECLSPVHARGGRDGAGNFTGSFTRRSRLSSSWWATGVPAPVGETSEAYEIDVMSGSTVKRTIATASPVFSYSAADQSADFGSAQAAITFRIYQLSSVVGRGYPLEVTL